jgi:peptidoglycan/LPS O-acetylase OafA/YrhL
LTKDLARPSARRDFRIDVLRGLSILSVLVLHFNIAYRLLKSPLGRLLPGPYLPNLVWNGNYGVTVFFVISGYLITSTSLRRFGSLERVSAKTFYAFRFARIFPCLLLVLTMITGLALAGIEIFRGNTQISIWLSDLSILTFWHNVMMAKFGYFNYCLNVLWSLSVEEVFYIAFPLLCLILRRSRWIVLVWVAAIVAGPIYRSYNSRNEILFLYGYLACFDAIAMGCITAVLVRSAKISRLNEAVRNLVQLTALAAMLWLFLRAGIDSVPVWGTSFMALGAAIFLLRRERAGLAQVWLESGPWETNCRCR